MLCLATVVVLACADHTPTAPAHVRELDRPVTSPDAVAMTDSTGSNQGLTASFEKLPATHNGETAFTFEVHFSAEPFGLSYKTVRDSLFDVTNGKITGAGRVTQGSNLAFRVTLEPSRLSDISFTVRGTTDCEADHAVCTADGRKLAGGESATVDAADLITMRVADAEVVEAEGATLDFVVKLSRAASSDILVQYRAYDGTAEAGADYEAVSSNFTFAAGDTTRTISVVVLTDSEKEESETVRFWLVGVRGMSAAQITRPHAVGTIHDSRPGPDLEVGASVDDASPEPGDSITLSATVTNAGDTASVSTTLRYYRSSDSTVTSSDTQVGTDAVGALAAAGTSAQSIDLTAPSSAGTYYYGACADTVANESDTSNNCSVAVRVDVEEPPPPARPDLEVGASVDDASPEPGGSFTLSATVTNSGDGASASTTLRYYRSSDSTVTSSDTQVGTDAVGALAAAGTSAQSVDLTAPSSAGTYYYGACADTVANESDTSNNCSAAAAVRVADDDPDPFITTWKTTAANESITIPVNGAGGTYTVDWGDGTTSTDVTGNQTHRYEDPGIYTVTISGEFTRIRLASGDAVNARKLTSIEQWGEMEWSSMEKAFWAASNMAYRASDAPDLSGVTDMSGMFEQASSFNGGMSSWDVSNVQNMNAMFFGADAFNGDISTWNVSNVRDMNGMFAGADSFNVDLSSWDVSNVRDMYTMFDRAVSFNGDLSSWDVSSVTDMGAMFFNAYSFNGDISTWNVSSVTNMWQMFTSATAFNGDLSSWNVSSVTDMEQMFARAASFNSDLSSWNVSSVTNMEQMFAGAVSFNSDLSSWNVSSVTNMQQMFAGAVTFNSDLSSWNVSSVTNMQQMFAGADAFKGDISSWNVSSVTNMQQMFAGADSFNVDLSSWDVSSVTNMRQMFTYARAFNSDISAWDVSNVTDMELMFARASSFRQNLGPWYVVLADTAMAGADVPGVVDSIVARNRPLRDHGPVYGIGSGADSARFEIVDGNQLRMVSTDASQAAYTVNITASGSGVFENGRNRKAVQVTVTWEKPPLTAAFEDMPGSHDGETEFAFRVRFSEGIRNSIAGMRDRAFDVTGGSVVKARRVNGDNKYWEIGIQPAGDDDVGIVLKPKGCGSGPCTSDRRRLSNRQDATVKGPVTAEFLNAPATHDGQTGFTFEVHFSEEPSGLSYETVRDSLFDVTNGSISNAGRVTQGRNLAFVVTVDPAATSDISLTVRGTTDCEADHAVCTADGRMLAGGASDTIEFDPTPVVTNALGDIAATPAERHAAYLPDVFTDPSGDDLAWTTSSGDTSVARASISGDSIIVNTVAEGTATVSVTATNPGGLSATDEFEVQVGPPDFNMDLHFTSRVSEEQAAEIRKARDRWETILAGTELANVTFDDELLCTDKFIESPGVVDDLLVIVDVAPIDGSPDLNTWAQAEPSCYARDSDGTPIVSGVLFDSSDIDEVMQSGLLEDLAMHEFGHALGFVGDFFEEKGLLGKGGDPHFKGALASEAFDSAGGVDYDGAKVPLSTRFWHWRESVLEGELMSVLIEAGAAVSAITLQAMADLGYVVDLSQADDYALPVASSASDSGSDRDTPGEVLDLSNDVVMGPVRMVDTNGRIVRIVSPSDGVVEPSSPRRPNRGTKPCD